MRLTPRSGRRAHHDGVPVGAALVRAASLEDRRRPACCVLAVSFGDARSSCRRTFLPSEDFANAQLEIELPPGGTLEDTARVSAAAAALLRKSPEVTDVIEFVGSERHRRDSQRRHLRQSRAAQSAHDEPEAMGTEHAAHA